MQRTYGWTPLGVVACQACDHTWYAGRCYIQCAECGHVYRTRLHLLLAYRWAMWRSYREWKDGVTAWSALTRGAWRPSRIYFCQCCIHDF
jgi:hypothetical protein